MDLFKRVVNIVKSNVNSSDKEINLNTYDDIYYEDNTILPENSLEKEYYKVLELEYGSNFKKIKQAYMNKKLLI